MPDPTPAAADETHALVSKSDLAQLQKAWGLFNKLYDDPDAGTVVRQALKKIDPSIRIPEIDVAEPLLKPVRERQDALETENKTLKEQIEAINKQREDDKALGDLQKALDAAQSKHRLTDEAMGEVRKLMAERNVADPEIAAQYVVANIEPAKPMTGTNFGPAKANILGIDGKSQDDDIARLHNDPVGWLDEAVPKIMAEVEEQQQAA